MKHDQISTILSTNAKDLKSLWQDTIANVGHAFESDPSSADCTRDMVTATDVLLQSLYTHYGEGTDMALVAVGGYGMGRQSMYSDIDILFLCGDIDACGGAVENILYALWGCGAKVGQSVHTIDSLKNDIQNDTVFLTSVMTARLVTGSQNIFDALQKHMTESVYPHNIYNFVDAKMVERKKRHESFGISRYVLEPNVKESKGGLRDFQNLLWIGQYAYGTPNSFGLLEKDIFNEYEQKTFAKSYMFMWRVRLALHCLSKRDNNILSFDMQLSVAKLLGYKDCTSVRGVEVFMQDYFKHAKNSGTLTCAIRAHMEDKYSTVIQDYKILDNKDFSLQNGRLIVNDEDIFSKQSIKILECFCLLENLDLNLHSKTLFLLNRAYIYIDDAMRNDTEAKKMFLSLVAGRKDPARILRLMNESRVLEAFLPEWKTIVCQMQYDMYHSYTTDEHTIRAIDILSKIERGLLKKDHPLCSKVFPKVVDREAMFVAVLLHDIAKGLGGDHSILGEEIARTVCPRLGMDSTATETVAWLIREHLTLSNFAQRRDVGDPKTIEDFCGIVHGITQLDMLTVLTVVDMRAVGQNVWNNWKAELIRRLYNTAKSYLSGSGKADVISYQVDMIKEELKKTLQENDTLSPKSIHTFITAITTGYALSASVKVLAMQGEFVLSKKGEKIHIHHDVENDYTEVLIQMPDRYGLMRDLSGVMAILGANVLDAQIHTLQNFGAVNMFRLQNPDGGIFSVDETTLNQAVDMVLSEELCVASEITKRISPLKSKGDAFSIAGRINIDNDASRSATLIEIRTKNRVGLLYILTRAVTELGLKIVGAKIATYGERVIDVFYIRDNYGFKLNRKSAQSNVKARLLDALAEKL